MTTTRKTQARPAARPQAPRTTATAEQVAQARAVPQAYVIPTQLLADVLKLVGSMPAQQVGLTFHNLQRLTPLEQVIAEATAAEATAAEAAPAAPARARTRAPKATE